MGIHLVLRRVLPLIVAGTGLLFASKAGAVDLNKHFLLGVRIGDYLPADHQKGGFRAFGGLNEGSERPVSIQEVPSLAIDFGYGVVKLGKNKRIQMILDLEAERVSSSMGPETVYRDRNASTRVPLPPFGIIGPDGDEEFTRMGIGDITLTPIFLNVLFQWSGKGGRADFYAGGGPGFVLCDVKESSAFRAFKSDFDGSDDLAVDDAFGLMVKTGSDVALKRDGNWLLYFEAEFISTGFLSSEGQVRWNSSDYFAGTQQVDTDGNNENDTSVPSDYRVVDAGKFRVDGATIGLGLRYRFGKGAPAPAKEPEPASQP